MNVIQKLLLVSLGLAIANFNLSAAQAKPSHHRLEGESQEDFNQRMRDQERKKAAAQKESLSLADWAYLKKDGPELFYKNWFDRLTDGKKITFLEIWMQQGIDTRSIHLISEANKAAISRNIEIDHTIIQKAQAVVKRDMEQGMLFLIATSSKKDAEKFGTQMKNMSEFYS